MKILIISPAAPNHYHRNRLLHIIRALSRNHTIKIASILVKDDRHRTEITPDYSVEKSRIRCYVDCFSSLFTEIPFEVSYYSSDSFRKTISKIYHHYDLILVKRFRAAQYIPENCTVPVIIDATDAMSLHYKQLFIHSKGIKQLLYYSEWKKYVRYEKKIVKKHQNIVVCSLVDQQYYKKLLPNSSIWLVPNVVDINDYKNIKPRSKNNKILFFGLLEKHANKEGTEYLIKHCMPFVWKTIPNAHLSIVGPNPPKSLYNLAKQNKLIHILGNVSQIKNSLAKADVVAVPILTGTGTKNKILQAWAAKRPIVTTSIGKSGLECVNNKHALVADTARTFASSIVKLLENDKLANELAENGYNLVSQKYSLNTMEKMYNKILKKVVRS